MKSKRPVKDFNIIQTLEKSSLNDATVKDYRLSDEIMTIRNLITALVLTAFFSCSKDRDKSKNEIVYSAWPIVKVEGATTGSVNQVVPITVNWPYKNGCEMVDKFAESRSGMSLVITTLGYTKNGMCTQDLGTKNAIYNFIATQPGVYELKFVNQDTYIIHTVTIN